MTSLVGNASSPVKDGTSSLPRRQSSFARPPLRALYDLLVAPMEGVSARPAISVRMHHFPLSTLHRPPPPQTQNRLLRQRGFSRHGASQSASRRPRGHCSRGAAGLQMGSWAPRGRHSFPQQCDLVLKEAFRVLASLLAGSRVSLGVSGAGETLLLPSFVSQTWGGLGPRGARIPPSPPQSG